MTVQANITGQGKGPKGEVRTGTEVHCTVKRSEYDVKLTVAVEGVRK